jgi:hypothetical protein
MAFSAVLIAIFRLSRDASNLGLVSKRRASLAWTDVGRAGDSDGLAGGLVMQAIDLGRLGERLFAAALKDGDWLNPHRKAKDHDPLVDLRAPC